MSESLNPAATQHLPPFITGPGQTDVLFIVMAVFVLLAVVGIGIFYFKLHALPEHLAHRGQKIQLEVVAVLALIATVFYFHPSTKAASSVFRTVTILPETNGRVAGTFVEINERVKQGQPLFRLDSMAQEAAVETARRKIAEI